ncbi:hypothetical protein ABZP36_011469 [Zizania latifolia]
MQPPVMTPTSSAAGVSLVAPASTASSWSCLLPPSPTRRQLLVSSGGLLQLLAAGRAGSEESYQYDPLTAAERAASESVSRRVGEAVRLLDLGRELQARGEFPAALASFTAVVSEYKDLALSEYARVGRALVLYEVGDRDESIAEMEDVSVALRGYPEIHAALAAALYADKHAPLLAENQFAIATLLDPHYTDLAYVRDTKHWPPSLVDSLQHFITLS